MAKARGTSIAARLFWAVGLPAAAVVVGLGVLAWRITETAVRDSLQRELAASAAVAASTIKPTNARVVLPGEEDTSRIYKRLVASLANIQRSTGSVRVMVFDAEEKVRGDGNGKLRIGDPAPRVALDRVEIERALQGTPTVSVPFTGDDGKRYMAAYARVPEEDDAPPDAVPLILAMEAPAAALDATSAVARKVAGLVGIAVLVVMSMAIVVARTITRPLLDLAAQAEVLGKGDLKKPLEIPPGDDEVARLGKTLESMRSALVERDAERQMMLAGIAHEVRNPLGGMELFSGLLEEGIQELDAEKIGTSVKNELAEQAARVRKELRYLTGVVNDFLAFARDVPLQREPVDVVALLDDVASLCRRDGAARLDLEYGEVGSVDMDRGRIKQALLNLVENALAATPKDGRVVLSATREDHALVLAVKDTGKGMDAETVARAFTPFFTTKKKGSGLGLPLVRKLARDHGGDATIDSVVDRGTTVSIRLPL